MLFPLVINHLMISATKENQRMDYSAAQRDDEGPMKTWFKCAADLEKIQKIKELLCNLSASQETDCGTFMALTHSFL